MTPHLVIFELNIYCVELYQETYQNKLKHFSDSNSYTLIPLSYFILWFFLVDLIIIMTQDFHGESIHLFLNFSPFSLRLFIYK